MTRLDSSSLRLALLACVAGAVVTACGKKGSGASEEEIKPVVAAATAIARVEPFTRTISSIGTVVARPGRFAALSAPSPTRVAQVYVAPGQRVAAGDLLVKLEQEGFSAATGGAEAALTAAQHAYDRALRLSNEGIVPRKDVEQAAVDLATARNAEVTARREQQLSVLRSPLSGVVTRMSAVLGASVDANQTLVEIVDPSAFDVELSLSPTDAGSVRQGARVTLSAGEATGGESLGTGRVTSISSSVDSTSRSVVIRVAMSTPRRPLRLGESVSGEIVTETKASAVVVPIEALVPEGVGFQVFVVDKLGVATAHEVTVGGRTKEKAEILEGLNGGETIVTKGAFGVEDSATVAKPAPVTP